MPWSKTRALGISGAPTIPGTRVSPGRGYYPLVYPGSGIPMRHRHPEVFFGPRGFLEAWRAKVKKPRFSRNCLFFGLAALGGKASVFLNMCGFLALVPQACNKNTWPKNHFRFPLT